MSVALDGVNGTRRSSDQAEQFVIRSIIDGGFPVGSELPPERTLAHRLGVGRPALREALQRLERDGWLTLRQGHPAQVNDYWAQGNLYTLVNLVQAGELPENLIVHLLELRAVLAPAFISQAVVRQPARVVALLADWTALSERGEEYAAFDWTLQKKTAIISGNPLFALILNSFDPVYVSLATRYFQRSECRLASRRFYQELMDAAMERDDVRAAQVVRLAMIESLRLWREEGSEETSVRETVSVQ
ncbi:fatty acid metabolism regulator protein [Peptococcaceae bacterium CEB3]|nr:fatty acid metabolism regulator protein [Peptococcaceae bacterium CEB3]